MKTQRLLVVLTVINLGLLVFLLAQTRVHIGAQGVRVWSNIDGSVLRGRALEIIDHQGRPRAAINLHPADPTGSYPETAILRLIDQNGRPSVKLSISERGGALALVSDAENTTGGTTRQPGAFAAERAGKDRSGWSAADDMRLDFMLVEVLIFALVPSVLSWRRPDAPLPTPLAPT
jgi:hypothetical protein